MDLQRGKAWILGGLFGRIFWIFVLWFEYVGDVSAVQRAAIVEV